MQTKCLFNVLPSMSYCFSFSETTWPNVPFVFKSQKPCERPKLRLVGLHCLKMCNIYLGLSKTTSKLKVIHSTTYSKEPVFLLKWSYLPYGLGIGGAKLQGLTHLPGVIALSPHQNASAVLVAILPHSHHSPLCLQFWSFGSRAEPITSLPLHVGSKPGQSTQTKRRERDWACSRMGPQGAASRSQGDNAIQHGSAAAWVHPQPAAKSLLLLFIFK